jgi:hypothetical protein
MITGRDLEKIPVEQVMSTPVLTVTEEDVHVLLMQKRQQRPHRNSP